MSQTAPVLVIEDDQAIRDFISLALTDEGFDVVTAPNGAVALEVLRDLIPRVILLDTRMPVMSGVEFAQKYRTLPGPKAPIVVLTAVADIDTVAQEIAAAATLPKPFDLDDLISLVSQFTQEQ